MYFFLAGRKDKNLPPWPVLLINTFMFIPMFVDLLSISIGLREPTNNIRYLTGILGGGALIVYLYPSFVNIVFPDGENRSPIGSFARYGLFLLGSISAYFVKDLDNIVVFAVLYSLTLLGSVGLIVIFSAACIKGIKGQMKA